MIKSLFIPLNKFKAESEAISIAVEFRQVNKVFNQQLVLKEISLKIKTGEIVVICGPSGSGKSTLIRLINQLETLSSGEIFVHQRSIVGLRDKELRALRASIGFVFQNFNLYAHLTALDNIALALIKIHKFSATEAHQYACKKLHEVGLADKAKCFPYQLSGGQQQRVAIARALATNANIILFDEPTSALDPEMIGEVLTVIRNLARSKITMIIVTHEMQFAREIADRIIFIDGGKILEQAHPTLFFTQPQHPRAQRFLEKVLSPLGMRE